MLPTELLPGALLAGRGAAAALYPAPSSSLIPHGLAVLGKDKIAGYEPFLCLGYGKATFEGEMGIRSAQGKSRGEMIAAGRVLWVKLAWLVLLQGSVPLSPLEHRL